MSDIIQAIEALHPAAAGTLSQAGPELPIPPQLDGSAIHRDFPDLPDTSLRDGISYTLRRFGELQAAGQLDTRDLPEG